MIKALSERNPAGVVRVLNLMLSEIVYDDQNVVKSAEEEDYEKTIRKKERSLLSLQYEFVFYRCRPGFAC